MLEVCRKLRKLVLLEQTLFGLPLALVGSILPFASSDFVFQGTWKIWLWMLLAFTAARTAGMSYNRLIDCEIDRQNPRTQDRPLPAGEISVFEVTWVARISLLFFIYACAMINIYCFLFAPLIAFLLWAYSYTKRYTPLCHFVLGLIEFFAPYLGWLAVGGGFDWPPLFLGLGVMLWISGMDIIYAIQDIEFDRSLRLRSVPAYLGERKSLLLGKLLHGGAVLFFGLAGHYAGVSVLYYVGLGIVSGLFFYQHRVVHTHFRRAFFVCNSLIAVTLCIFALGDVWLGHN